MRLGLDIGGTKTAAIVVDENDQPIGERLRRPSGFGAEAVVDTAVAMTREAAALVGIAPDEFRSIGVGIPGTVDAASGRVSHAVNLGVTDLDLGRLLGERLGTRVTVENDVKAAALGVHRLLDDGSMRSMAFLNLGTGLAAALILDGRLWRGSRGAAGEIGHIPVDPLGPWCSCGQRGCLETVASGSAIARDWGGAGESPVRALFRAAAEGDPAAIAARSRLAENVASAARLILLTVDVDHVVIGGGVSTLGDALLTAVRGALTRWGDASPFLAAQGLGARISLAPQSANVAAIGAAIVGRLSDSLART